MSRRYRQQSPQVPSENRVNQMANKNDAIHLNEVTLASVAAEMAKCRMTASVRKILGTFAANCRFRADECVYNRDTKEHGLVKQVYERDGVTMYKVFLPATPQLLRWGHFVSDWAEDVLELSDNVLLRSPGI
jgi:hypothetical protein